MEILITTVSILTITGLVWLVNKALSIKICPICIGVFVTWLWVLIGLYTGWLEDGSWKLIAAIAMGGSIVGISYQIEKRLILAGVSAGKLLLFKIFFVPVGFVGVYSLISGWWLVFAVCVLFLIAISLIFLRPPPTKREESKKTVKDLEEKMKDCC